MKRLLAALFFSALLQPVPGSAATVVETFGSKSHIDYHLPGYLVAGRVSIRTHDDWNTVAVGYSVIDQVYSRLLDLYITVGNAEIILGGAAVGLNSGYLGPAESGDRFFTRWESTFGEEIFGSNGAAIAVTQFMFGNEGFRRASVVVSDRSETSINLLLWDWRVIDETPPLVQTPLPASGVLLSAALFLLLRRKPQSTNARG